MLKRINTEILIGMFNAKHGVGKYDYSLVNYVNMFTGVDIICGEHGIYNQKPRNHLYGSGCRECGMIRSKTKCVRDVEEFISSCSIIYDNKYDYSKVVYKNNKTKIVVGCPIHGDFGIYPHQHEMGVGCQLCSNKKLSELKTKSKDTVLREFRNIHGDRYDYSNVEYSGSFNKVEIICAEHGSFLQLPSNHLRGAGCNKCGNASIGDKMSTDLFKYVEKAKIVHNNKYGYENIFNGRIGRKIRIICPIHGEFHQSITSHINGSGCNECAKLNHGYSESDFIKLCGEKCGTLYVIECFGEKEKFIKVGITSRSIFDRVRYNSIPYRYEILFIVTGHPSSIYKMEKHIHKINRKNKYVPVIEFGGKTECFSDVDMNYIHEYSINNIL